ncbi:hypothetical protein [Arabiibacter massiliensis]|uniref:hypothetical protein n=1 Tax=Arabiibacter massiliensis TaxID=1870985 RepID=UPI0009B9EAB8|nr:hypothetical protein [Arabiibacter massiliensis]
MIKVKKVYIGNEIESYIQGELTDGVNIITSDENHVGKTIVMQSIMYALGSDPMFPPSFKHKQYFFIVDIDDDGQELSILRNKDTFVIKSSETITPLESRMSFDEYWSEHISPLPTIIKNGVPTLTGLSLYTQMAFVAQAGRNTSNTVGSYFKKDDFTEMIFAIKGLEARQMDSETEKELKRKREVLKTRKNELFKKSSTLRRVGTSLEAVSPTADREATIRFVAELDGLKKLITDSQKRRNHSYTRMKKNQSVLDELRSLNREIKVGSVVCMNCGQESIGYKMPGSDFVFDITTDDMRRQIVRTVEDRIDSYAAEVDRLDRQIRELQRRFNSLADTREITLEDIYVAREDYIDLEEIDRELSDICDELDRISERLKDAKRVDKELSEDRADLKASMLETMNMMRQIINDDSGAEEYTDLFTSAHSPYMGSEATEFFLARVYSLAIHVAHGLPILIDSFRAEELSTAREERALPLFVNLPNQVILSATLKGQEAGKYKSMEQINNIDYAGYTVNKLLGDVNNEEFGSKVTSFGIRLSK